jgi:hypothetical protein
MDPREQLSLTHRVQLKSGGWTEVRLEGGMTLADLPAKDRALVEAMVDLLRGYAETSPVTESH